MTLNLNHHSTVTCPPLPNTTVKDTARRPTGIERVMTNGQWVVANGRYVHGTKPGRMVRYSARVIQ